MVTTASVAPPPSSALPSSTSWEQPPCSRSSSWPKSTGPSRRKFLRRSKVRGGFRWRRFAGAALEERGEPMIINVFDVEQPYRCACCHLFISQNCLRPKGLLSSSMSRICFHRECIRAGTQIFAEADRRLHSRHEQYCLEMTDQALSEVVQPHREGIQQVKQQFSRRLLATVHRKLQEFQAAFEHKYSEICRRISEAFFRSFDSAGASMRAGEAERGESLWLLNHSFHEDSEAIREGLLCKMLLEVNRFAPKLEEEFRILKELLEELDLGILNKYFKDFLQKEESSAGSEQPMPQEVSNHEADPSHSQTAAKNTTSPAPEVKMESCSEQKPTKLVIVAKGKEEGEGKESQQQDDEESDSILSKSIQAPSKQKKISKRCRGRPNKQNKAEAPKSKQIPPKTSPLAPKTISPPPKRAVAPPKRVSAPPKTLPTAPSLPLRSQKKVELLEINETQDLILMLGVQVGRLAVNTALSESELARLMNLTSPREVLVNASIDFTGKFFQLVEPAVLHELAVFEESWDMQHYYSRFVNSLYFPATEQDSKLRHKLHFSAEHWALLPNLQSLWISSDLDLSELRRARRSYAGLLSLRIEPCLCVGCYKESRLLMDQLAKEFKTVKSLRCLQVSHLIFDAEVARFVAVLLQNNPGLETLVFNDNSTIDRGTLREISKLKLKRLFIRLYSSPSGSQDFSELFSIASLQYLTLQRCKFSQPPQGIARLQQLVHLDLFNCVPVDSSLVEQLHPATYGSLVHLNLGYSQVDNRVLYSLPRFSRLQDLNLDDSRVELYPMLIQLEKSPLRSVARLSIFHCLVCSKPTVEMGNAALELLPKVFPSLLYLDIGALKSPVSKIELRGCSKLVQLCLHKDLIKAVNTKALSAGVNIIISEENAKR